MILAHRLPSLLAGLSLAALMVVLPARANAQACATSADCPAGTTCQKNAVPEAKPGCAGPDCPADTGTGGAAIVAPDAIRMACAPAACTADSDCGGSMVCHTETISSCSGGTAPCSRDMKCDPAPPPTCTETKVSACAYKWQLACKSDADCGDGFACEPNVISTCTGGGPAPGGGTGSSTSGGTGTATPGTSGGAGGSTATDLPARVAPTVDGGASPMCTSMTSFPGWCRVKATTCNTDADCPAPWTCVDGAPSGGTTDPANTGSGSGGGTRPVPVDDTAGAAPRPETIVARVKVCQSPASFPPRGAYATDTGSQGPTSGGATPGAGNGAPESAKTSNAGCSVGGGATAPVASLAGLMLGLALAVRRVRRR